MDINQYKRYWSREGESLYVYSPGSINRSKVNEDTFTFLTQYGLPADAAPCLNFTEMREDIFQSPDQVFRIAFDGLTGYRMFGSNASGDPVCIDTTEQGQVVYLNHDNYFERVYINNSIFQFAECLITYRDFIASLIDADVTNYSRRKFSDEEFGELMAKFSVIDHSCMAENSFWAPELAGLMWERDNE